VDHRHRYHRALVAAPPRAARARLGPGRHGADAPAGRHARRPRSRRRRRYRGRRDADRAAGSGRPSRACPSAAHAAADRGAASRPGSRAGECERGGCDPATCAAILQAGYATTGQVILQPGVSLPGPGSLIVATGTIRGQYGAELTGSAPAVIAVFGTGAQSVQLRVAVAGGEQAYSAALAARQQAGHTLLAGGRVHVSGAVRAGILAGDLDPRLVTALRLLSAHYALYVVRVADPAPTAAANVPYRMAQVLVLKTKVRHRRVSELAGMERLLNGEPPADRAELSAAPLPGGQRVLQIVFAVPGPQ